MKGKVLTLEARLVDLITWDGSGRPGAHGDGRRSGDRQGGARDDPCDTRHPEIVGHHAAEDRRAGSLIPTASVARTDP
jgi:hypothetical protein